MENLKNWFYERGYPGGLFDEQLQKIKGTSREELLRPEGMDYPHLKNKSKIIKKHIKHAYANPEVRSVFTPLPFVSFGSVQNLKSLLTKFKS